MAEKNKSTSKHQATAFERVQLARHPERPYTLDFIERLFEDFTEIHGDRRYADDPAIVCGFARFHGMPVLVVGHQKGRDTRQRQFRNFGMPKPEGYRKAIRAMKLGDKPGTAFPAHCYRTFDCPGDETTLVGSLRATLPRSRNADGLSAHGRITGSSDVPSYAEKTRIVRAVAAIVMCQTGNDHCCSPIMGL